MLIYHNPRCSKSRQILKMIEEKGYSPKIKLYLEEPIKPSELKDLLTKLDLEAVDILRTKESVYKELTKKIGKPTNSQAIEWIVKNPILLERPIVVNEDKAVIGRPPENILQIL